MDLGEIEWGGVDWIGLAQDRDKWTALMNAVMNLRVPSNAGKLSSGFTAGGLSSTPQLHRVSSFSLSATGKDTSLTESDYIPVPSLHCGLIYIPPPPVSARDALVINFCNESY
jgi:hypothetical protein